jgi:hypothetical protein
MAETRRNILKRSLAIHIGELQRVCELTTEQMKKFQVAAKGVVERSMEAWEDQFGQPARPPQPVQLWVPVRQDFPFGHVHPHDGLTIVADLVDHDIWVKALENTLTAEQKKRFQDHRLQREAFHRGVMLQGIVAEWDRSLLLTVQQREQVLAMLEQRVDELPMGGVWDASSLLRQFPAKVFEGILSEAQLEFIHQIKQAPALMDIEIEKAIPLLPALPAFEVAPGNKAGEDDDDSVRQTPLS